MCENIEKSGLIQVQKKTNIGKYEFLKAYYTGWNRIIHPSPRILIDTHAGTGAVELTDEFGKSEKIYGSSLLAILKTLRLSKGLKIILVEKKRKNFSILENQINEIRKNGLPIGIYNPPKQKQEKLNKKRSKKVKRKKEYKFPDSFNYQLPYKYKLFKEKTKAEIELHHAKIEDIIEDIIKNNFCDQEIQSRNGKIKKIFPKGLFLVDPCGAVDWKVIEKIGTLAIDENNELKEGIELILNLSSMAMYRNPKNRVLLAKIFGLSEKQIKEKFPQKISFQKLLEEYIKNLSRFWNYIIEIKVPLSLKLKVRKKEVKESYYLLYCTNNPSGISLAKNKISKINFQFTNLNYKDLRKFC
ncbi:MAG: hypothetical protein ACTSVL_06730 [Promethearchaeota archaeon]